jgi:probable rRNA maturation factor
MRSFKRANSVTITSQDPRFKFHKKKLTQLIQSVLKQIGYRGVALSVVFVTDSEIKRLNKRHLNHSWVTDVLAFPFLNSKASVCPFLGEVIISPNRAKIYSRKISVSFEEELLRYVCHGILHLKGFSDHSKKTRQIMERKENLLIRSVQRFTKGLFRYGH